MAAPTLNAISDFPGLLTYLEEVLDWPINEANFEEATFDYSAADLGLKEDAVGGAIEIKQLRPLVTGQPWGVFFLNLPHKHLPQTIVRNILGRLTIKTRASANTATRPAFLKSDLLFITATGHGEGRRLAFAHFQDDPAGGNAATLKLLGWDSNDTQRRTALNEASLKDRLHWPDDPADVAGWRKQWASAFQRADTRTVVRDSKAMAKELAALARRIRDRAKELIAAQTDSGSLVVLHKAFKEALIHDLTPEGFADTYAQTIAYGLLSTAISRASGALTQDDVTANVAGTSPFLKEMLGQFLEAGGKKGKAGQGLDFDELGVSEVVELLRTADMEAVLADFDRKNPDEDPVIHFYELFLKEYDAEQKVKRGVFYTPRPVVGFIVRSVDEVLRTEFHLADGLASTATWGEVIAASAARGDEKPITLPADAALTDPFVRILDPATGTGTFLVECVDLIYKTMLAKWQAEKRKPAEIKALWNEYVPNHLLPRLTGFELMMAPYAIAHVKLGLKLSDTGYTFGSDARAQIYLTNALEPAQDLDMQLAFMSEALAHEAKAANEAKRTRFSVLVGNPPYSEKSANMQDFAKEHINAFRFANGVKIKMRNALQHERNLNDDYVKFFGFILGLIDEGAVGIITNRYFLESNSLVGLRQRICEFPGKSRLVDLMGSAEEAQRVERLLNDENVFDIKQGVAVTIISRQRSARDHQSLLDTLVGKRDTKYNWLQVRLNASFRPKDATIPTGPHWSLGRSSNLPDAVFKINTVLPFYSTLVASNRDPIVVGFDRSEVTPRVTEVANSKLSDREWSEAFDITLKTNWNVRTARSQLRDLNVANYMRPFEYRPFDQRILFYHKSLVWQMAPVPSDNVLGVEGNVVLISLGKNRDERTNGYWVASTIADKSVVGTRDNASGFPLWLKPQGAETRTLPNIAPAFANRVAALTGLTWDDCVEGPKQGALAGVIAPKPTQTAMFATRRERGEVGRSFGPRDLFDWIYAVLHSPAYRQRYADYLKSDFARVPLPGSRALFEALVPLGTRLVALHLLDEKALPELADPKGLRLAGSGEPRVAQAPTFDPNTGRSPSIPTAGSKPCRKSPGIFTWADTNRPRNG